MTAKLNELKQRLTEVNDLNSAGAVLGWDQSTYMPPGGAQARGRQLATLSRISFEKFIDPAIGKLLDELQAYEESLPYDSDDASLIRVTRKDYERATRVPPAFMSEMTAHQSDSFHLWIKARPENNFRLVLPALEKTLDYSRRLADYFPGYQHIADPLIDHADYCMKVETLVPIFGELREQLVPIVQAIASQEPVDDSCVRIYYPEAGQLAFCEKVVSQLGYDYQRGRHDKTYHPFTTSFSIGDVRITTRIKENYLSECLYSMIHEAGHALYEQGICKDYEGTPLASGTSAGVHESQSRLWENVVGRGREFWQYFYPRLQVAFPEQLKTVSMEEFYRAVNKVEKSLIRTDADEVTYNLHIMLRFDLELDLLEGKLAVKDLPDAWQARFKEDFGINAPDDRDGVLQDVHWYAGVIGGVFQGYTLGNILGAQFYAAAVNAVPEIPNQVSQGNFSSLLDWLQKNIYQHGRKFTAPELVERVTGSPMSIQPYIQYIKNKYGEIYHL